MLTKEDLVAVITAEWPHLVHGRDFWVGHPVAEGSGEQIGPAFILAWAVPDMAQPTGAALDFLIAAHQWAIDAARAPKSADVNRERDRRIEAGRSFAVTGYGDIPLTGRHEDRTALMGLLIRAQALKADGVTDPVLIVRDANNQNHALTPDQMIELISAGIAWIEDVMQRSWDMKDQQPPFVDGIPADYTNDEHWPA